MTPTEQTLNISSTSNDWRGLALSNFGLSPFVLDGVLFASVEGFIQGIKFREGDPQRDAAFASSGWPAKHLGDTADRSGAYWDGACLPYGSPEHHRLIERAIRARIAQSKGLQAALKSTVGLTLIYDTGAGAECIDNVVSGLGILPDFTDMRKELLTSGLAI